MDCQRWHKLASDGIKEREIAQDSRNQDRLAANKIEIQLFGFSGNFAPLLDHLGALLGHFGAPLAFWGDRKLARKISDLGAISYPKMLPKSAGLICEGCLGWAFHNFQDWASRLDF